MVPDETGKGSVAQWQSTACVYCLYREKKRMISYSAWVVGANPTAAIFDRDTRLGNDPFSWISYFP